jgi:predicted nucleic acid-binding protein
MLVISDNSPIRYLVLLDCIHLLPALFSRVTIPAEVQAELQRPRTPAVVRAWIANPPNVLARDAARKAAVHAQPPEPQET